MHFFDRSLWFASVLSVCTLWGGGAVAQTAPAASEQELQRELILRTFGSDSEVLLGRLPSDLPIELPLPDQARIIGTIVAAESQEDFSPYDYLIYLDVPRSPQQVAASYQEQLRHAGWRAPEDLDLPRPGFVSDDGVPFDLISSFCKDDQFLVLSVTVLPNPQAATVTVQTRQISTVEQSYSTCHRSERAIAPSPTASIPLPELTAPLDTKVERVRGGGEEDNWRSTASIESPLTDRALVAHYVSQLEQAGWTQQASDTSDATAWSFLTLQDDEGQLWQGLLSIASADEPNSYTASIIVLNTSPTRSGFF